MKRKKKFLLINFFIITPQYIIDNSILATLGATGCEVKMNKNFELFKIYSVKHHGLGVCISNTTEATKLYIEKPNHSKQRWKVASGGI